MHESVKTYCESIKSRFPSNFKDASVLDVGSLDINGNNRYLFEGGRYIGIDVGEGKNVDIVCSAHLFNEGTYDTIISTEMLEHNKYWKESLINMCNLLNEGGLLLITAAGEKRREHGTTRTSPKDAPFTNDYYKNITVDDINSAIDYNLFYEYNISELGEDIRFFGVKK